MLLECCSLHTKGFSHEDGLEELDPVRALPSLFCLSHFVWFWFCSWAPVMFFLFFSYLDFTHLVFLSPLNPPFLFFLCRFWWIDLCCVSVSVVLLLRLRWRASSRSPRTPLRKPSSWSVKRNRSVTMSMKPHLCPVHFLFVCCCPSQQHLHSYLFTDCLCFTFLFAAL